MTESLNGMPGSKQKYQPVATPLATPAPQTVFHYTDQNGLLGIIKDKSLRLSSIRHLNDAAELRHAAGILREKLKHEIEDSDGAWQEICEVFQHDLDALESVNCF